VVKSFLLNLSLYCFQSDTSLKYKVGEICITDSITVGCSMVQASIQCCLRHIQDNNDTNKYYQTASLKIPTKEKSVFNKIIKDY
jgi:hypothetical protein